MVNIWPGKYGKVSFHLYLGKEKYGSLTLPFNVDKKLELCRIMVFNSQVSLSTSEYLINHLW